ncbi:carboxypeptidase regulatory-like domain-containing protein [bacterium]|nr:carboxypeptidase regulatory-like domain-containing protein [bacterium]
MKNQNFKYVVIALVVATLGLAVVAVIRSRGVEQPVAQLASNGSTDDGSDWRSGIKRPSSSGGSRGDSRDGNSGSSASEDRESGGQASTEDAGSSTEKAPGEESKTGPVIGGGSPLPGGGGGSGTGNGAGIALDKNGNPLPGQYRPDSKNDPSTIPTGDHRNSDWNDANDQGGSAEGDVGSEDDTEPTPTETPTDEQATLGGRVLRGESGVADAQLQLTADNYWKQVTSDSDGNYYFPPLNPGDYTLRLVYPAMPNPQRLISLGSGESNTSEDFVIPDLPPMYGQVVNDMTGEGVKSPSVSIWQGQKGLGEVLGDGDGNFELFPLDPGSYTAKVIANGFRPGDTSFEVSDNADYNDHIQIRLTPAVTLSGRVVDANGFAVSGALVALFSPGSVYGGTYSSQPFKTTGAGGDFLFSSLPEDGGNVRAGAYREGYVPAYSETIDPASSDGVVGDIVLPTGTKITGRVVTADATPIDYVLVEVIGGFSNTGGIYQRFNYQLPSNESTADGVFELSAIEPGSVTLRFTATDYVTKEEQYIVSGPTMDIGDVEMESSSEPKEGRLAGMIITDEGKGLPSQNVYIKCLDCSSSEEALQNSDSQGRFSFEEVTEGTYSIDISGSTFRGNLWVPLSQRYVGAQPGGESVVLLYDMSHSIKADLIDTNGDPIRRFQVGINVLDQSPSTVSGQKNEIRMRYESEMSTSEGVMTLPYLISGTANLTISVSGGGTEEISNVYIAPTESVIDLGQVVISQGGTVKGYVVAEEGGGSLQGVTVQALPPDGSSGSHPLNSLSFSTITGPTGEFELSGLPETTIDLQFRLSGRVATRRRGIPITPGETSDVAEVALPLAAIIEGKVTDSVSGNPISNVLINFNNWLVYSDREGKYRADMVPPGDIAMIAIHNIAGDSHEKFAAQFIAPAGETTIYDFEMVPQE